MIPEHARLEACLRDLTARRPFEDYAPQPDTAERKRMEMQAIPFALPERREPDFLYIDYGLPFVKNDEGKWERLAFALPEKRDE